jgi:hypothetical protein
MMEEVEKVKGVDEMKKLEAREEMEQMVMMGNSGKER